MPSSISNFKERLRLPRLFFRRPSREEQIHGGPPLEYERPIPPAPWRGIAVVISIVVIAVTTAWELYCRSLGYGPTLNDNEDLWTMARRRVQPESIVVVGDSRAWFDVDLDEFQKGLGKGREFSWHDHLQFRPRFVFRAAGFSAGGAGRTRRETISQPDAGSARER